MVFSVIAKLLVSTDNRVHSNGQHAENTMSLKATLFRAGFNVGVPLMWRKRQSKHIRSEDVQISVAAGSITARVYTPQGQGPFPALVYYHGGGFVVGSLKAYDRGCRDICDKTGHIIVSVDYRLAPEFPFPVAAEDSIVALEWVAENSETLNIDASRLFVGGDSAGGNLAAVVALAMRNRNPNTIKGQVLIYPVVDHYSKEHNSYIEKATGYALTTATMKWFWDSYLANSPILEPNQFEHALATPGSAESLKDLPPALVITAENDPLHDEGVAYAQRLKAEGCEVQFTDYAGYAHGFIGVAGPGEEHDRGVAEIAQWLRSQA